MRQAPAQQSRHGAIGAAGATGLDHGTMNHITGRCGRHRHNGPDTGRRGLPGQRAGPRDNDPYHGAVWQTPAQRSGTARQTDHGTLTGHTAQQPARTGQLTVPGTVARHATSHRQGTRPRLPDICPGEYGLFARRQGQNPVVVSLTTVSLSELKPREAVSVSPIGAGAVGLTPRPAPA